MATGGNALLDAATGKLLASQTPATFAAILNPQTGTTYSIAVVDAGAIVSLDNANPILVTLSTDATIAYPLYYSTQCWRKGAGKVTFVAEGGATVLIERVGCLSLPLTNSVCTVTKVAANTWLLSGPMVG